ncbi:hypothetical protein FBG13_02445 [Cobetia marina]|uniref:T6SS effector BTH_I2691 family protein n=1 Tax=Cobetia marina TaxID=28258 RepID=UPI0010AE58D9|nr:T6SS effector BTH_I2691 family protein [Cobetia marina]TKD64157.1 hypothetical protein FBG13_02445 [Cobetia marina]
MSGQIVNQHVALSVVNGECRFCKRTGFPILPVRYAVCQRNDANQQIPELSEDRVKAFTDIKLDQTLENGKRTTRVVPSEVKEEIAHSTSSQVNKYILRQLRSGYLYLFDKDNPDGMYWSAFAITADGKYYQFPVKQPPSLDKMAMPCTLESGNRDGESDEEKVTRVKNESLQASLVTITTPDKSGDVYYAYTEHAWPEGFLDEVKSRILSGDPWCDKYLQKFNVPDWKAGVAQDHAFSLEELEQVAEYSPGAAGLDEQFWSSGPKRGLYSPEEMKQTMSERLRYASTDYEGRGLILAVNDEIGIIQELNAYRHQALAAVDDFFHPGEDLASKKMGEERKRKMLCKQAIDKFHKNFELLYPIAKLKEANSNISKLKKEISERDSALDMKIEAEADEDRREYYKSLKSQDSYFDGQLRVWQAVKHNKKIAADKVVKDHLDQLRDMYRTDDLEDFNDEYKKHTAHCHAILSLHDSDYALWVEESLVKVMSRYSTTDVSHGVYASNVASLSLKGGVLSPASGSLWRMLAKNIVNIEGLILRVLFFNNVSFISYACEKINSLKISEQLSVLDLVSWKEQSWSEIASAVTLQNNLIAEKLVHRIRGNNNFSSAVIGSSLIALANYSSIGGSSDKSFSKEQSKAMKSFLCYQQMVSMIGPSSDEIPAPIIKSYTMKISEYLKIIKSTSDYLRHEAKGYDKTGIFKSSHGNVGNIQSDTIENDREIVVRLPSFVIYNNSDNKDASQANNYAEKREASALSQVIKTGFSTSQPVAEKIFGRYSKSAVALISLCSLMYNVVEDGVENEEGAADWSKILGVGVSMLQVTMSVVEGKAQLIGVTNYGARWKIMGNSLGIAAGALAIWEGLELRGQRDEAVRLGHSVSAGNLEMMSSVSISGGVISIAIIGATLAVTLTVTLLVGLATLLIGYAHTTLVGPAVQTWVNRSILGKHSSQVQEFGDILSEQSSLELVFKGVVVELQYIKPDPSAMGPSAAQIYSMTNAGDVEIDIKLKVTAPATPSFYLKLEFIAIDVGDRIFNWEYKKEEGGKVAKLSRGNETYPSEGGNSQPGLAIEGDYYMLEWRKEITKNLNGENFFLRIFYKDSDTSVLKNDTMAIKVV